MAQDAVKGEKLYGNGRNAGPAWPPRSNHDGCFTQYRMVGSRRAGEPGDREEHWHKIESHGIVGQLPISP